MGRKCAFTTCCRFVDVVDEDVLFEVVGLSSKSEGYTGWEQVGAHLST